MTTLIEFARAMRTSIQNINENSYNNFITRIGKDFFCESRNEFILFQHYFFSRFP